MLEKHTLKNFYIKQGKSMQDIANILGCSLHKVNYWMDTYSINTRSISEAIYLKCNPNGDPFVFRGPKNMEEATLFGMGIGLYWGEGTKANKNTVRLGNTDPKLIKTFIAFLIKFFSIKKKDLRFGLQIFNDIEPNVALDFWIRMLKIKKHQFCKPTVTRSVSQGTYRKKAQYGVLTVYYCNTKMRDKLVNLLPM